MQDLIVNLARKVEKMESTLVKMMDLLKSLSSTSSEQAIVKQEIEAKENTVRI